MKKGDLGKLILPEPKEPNTESKELAQLGAVACNVLVESLILLGLPLGGGAFGP